MAAPPRGRRALARLRVLLGGLGPGPARPRACAGEAGLRRVDGRRGHQVPEELRATRGTAVEYLETGAPRPSHAEKVATLLLGQRHATLSTLAREAPCTGHPFGSLVNVAVGEGGELLTFLSRLAEHRQNLERDPRCSLLVAEAQGAAGEGQDPLSHARATLLGRLELVEKTPARCASFRRRHPRAYYVDFDDFGCFVMRPEAVRYIGGFGEMSWVPAGELAAAAPDEVAAAAASAVEHMNQDHADATLAIVRRVGGLEAASAARVLAIDRYGFEALAELPGGARRARVAFEKTLATPEELREAFVALVGRARGQE